jgi:hypothetical protein
LNGAQSATSHPAITMRETTVHAPIVAPACRPVLVADPVSPLLLAQLDAIEAAVLAEMDEERV